MLTLETWRMVSHNVVWIFPWCEDIDPGIIALYNRTWQIRHEKCLMFYLTDRKQKRRPFRGCSLMINYCIILKGKGQTKLLLSGTFSPPCKALHLVEYFDETDVVPFHKKHLLRYYKLKKPIFYQNYRSYWSRIDSASRRRGLSLCCKPPASHKDSWTKRSLLGVWGYQHLRNRRSRQDTNLTQGVITQWLESHVCNVEFIIKPLLSSSFLTYYLKSTEKKMMASIQQVGKRIMWWSLWCKSEKRLYNLPSMLI